MVNYKPTPETILAVLTELTDKGRANMALNAIAGGGSSVDVKKTTELKVLNALHPMKNNQLGQYGNSHL